jgi:Fe-S-cluster containining protein
MPPDHDIILRDWQANARQEDDANYRFLRSLKLAPNPDHIDELARELHQEAFRHIDCTRCANCCKTMPPAVTTEDIRRISRHLNLSEQAFIAAYLTVDPDERCYVIKTARCPFLGDDDRCTIYAIRPDVCRQFPHTDKEGFSCRTHLHSANALHCPAVYYLVKQMRRRLRHRRPQR